MDITSKISATLKNGGEPFLTEGRPASFELLEFWRWSVSDLVSNATRGRLAEFIVAKALDIDTTVPRDEWQAHDLTTPSGLKVEVKSAAYVQSWVQRTLSLISFSIKKTRAWSADTNRQSKVSTRQADAYVFALLAHTDKATINPLDLDQWQFFVLSSAEIDAYPRSDSSITLKSLQKLCSPVSFGGIKGALSDAMGRALRLTSG